MACPSDVRLKGTPLAARYLRHRQEIIRDPREF
jgi:hypothetical protein